MLTSSTDVLSHFNEASVTMSNENDLFEPDTPELYSARFNLSDIRRQLHNVRGTLRDLQAAHPDDFDNPDIIALEKRKAELIEAERATRAVVLRLSAEAQQQHCELLKERLAAARRQLISTTRTLQEIEQPSPF